MGLPHADHFLTNRFKQYQQAMKIGHAVMDRSFIRTDIRPHVSAAGLSYSEEYAVYNNLLNTLLEHVDPPRLLVYLQVDTDEAIRRIYKRGRRMRLMWSANTGTA
jgi:deoxyadenosine/deoxycytidine kinase